MSYIKKLDHIGIYDATTSERMHYIIAQYSNNTLDLYCNKVYVNSIYGGEIKVPLTDSDDPKYLEKVKRQHSSSLKEFKTIKVNDFEIDDKRIYLIKDESKEEGYAGRLDDALVDIYSIDLKLRTRIGRDFVLLNHGISRNRLLDWMKGILEDKVREFYKPCTSFVDFGGNFVFSHRHIVSLYSTLMSKWSHLQVNHETLGLSADDMTRKEDRLVKIVFEVIQPSKSIKGSGSGPKKNEHFLVALFANGRVVRVKTKKWESGS